MDHTFVPRTSSSMYVSYIHSHVVDRESRGLGLADLLRTSDSAQHLQRRRLSCLLSQSDAI